VFASACYDNIYHILWSLLTIYTFTHTLHVTATPLPHPHPIPRRSFILIAHTRRHRCGKINVKDLGGVTLWGLVQVVEVGTV